MKAISLRQPWASLIAAGAKTSAQPGPAGYAAAPRNGLVLAAAVGSERTFAVDVFRKI